MSVHPYKTTSEDPSLPIAWEQMDGTPVDLSAATFALKLISRDTTPVVALTKTTGITGFAAMQGTAPNTYNALVTWAAAELVIAAGTYDVQFVATVGGRDRAYAGEILVVVTTAS